MLNGMAWTKIECKLKMFFFTHIFRVKWKCLQDFSYTICWHWHVCVCMIFWPKIQIASSFFNLIRSSVWIFFVSSSLWYCRCNLFSFSFSTISAQHRKNWMYTIRVCLCVRHLMQNFRLSTSWCIFIYFFNIPSMC